MLFRSPPMSRPLRLRIGIATAENNLHWAQMMQAFCCLRTEPEPPEILL